MTQQQWEQRARPMRLQKRYEFDNYESLRIFLDQAANLSEAKGIFPDIGFGRTHASFTIHADEASEQLTDQQREFSSLLDSLESSKQA